MAKFTPRPWKFNRRDGDWYILDAAGGCIQCNAQYYPWVSGNVEDWHLMAAAPEMYEALSAIVPEGDDWWCPTCKEALDGSRVTNSECCDTCGTYLAGINAPEWLKAARAALAKADGHE